MEVTQKAFGAILDALKNRHSPEEVVDLVLEESCRLANVIHGSFILVNHLTGLLEITSTFGPDWTEEKKSVSLKIGQGITGRVAATGQMYVVQDVTTDPHYLPLFSYVKSELTLPVLVRDKVWGVINLDGLKVDCFSEETIRTITLFAEMVAFAFTLQAELNEQHRIQASLIHSQKLVSLGKIIAGIAHEINNPLTTILGHASMMELEPTKAPDPSTVHSIIRESKRAGAIMKTLLEFARKEVGTKQVINVNDLIAHVCEIKKYHLNVNNITLIEEKAEEWLPIEANPQQISQVLLNLVNNAEQAMPGKEQGVIKIRSEVSKELVRILISDNGPGITQEIQGMIFDPFFSTQKEGEGSGLGLFVAHSTVASHGGRLYLGSSSPKGTTFVLEFPLNKQRPSLLEPQTKEPVAPSLPASNYPAEMADSKRILGRVLVVDDEEGILQFISRFLTALRIQVITASNGLDGLKKLQGATFDLILTDIKMPGLNGLEFYERAKEMNLRYASRFVFMSGDLMKDSTRQFITETGCRFIEKPFSGQALRENIIVHLQQRPVALADSDPSLSA